MSGLEVDGTGGAVLVFMGQSEAQHRILREVLCRWVRGEQEQRSRVKHMTGESGCTWASELCSVDILQGLKQVPEEMIGVHKPA